MKWEPQKGKQEQFLSESAFEAFYGGSAGPGKTESLLMGGTRSIKFPEYHGVIFRRTYPEIERTLIPRSMRYFKKSAAWDGTHKKWTWRSGAVLRFCHLQYEDSVYEHQSSEYQYIAFDELPEFTQFQYEFMKTRCRTINPNIPKMIRSGGNPIGIGKQWVKRYFRIGNGDEAQRFLNPRTKQEVVFIPARLEDNPLLMEGDPDYATTLEGMEDQSLAKALRYGDWSGEEGQFFDDFWLEKDGRPYHKISGYIPTEFDEIFASCDWGHFPDAFNYQLHAVSKISLKGLPTFLRIRTFARIHGHKKLPPARAKEIYLLERATLPKGKTVSVRYGDPSMWNTDGITGSSIAEEFKVCDSKGNEITKITFVKANNDKAQGWAAMRYWLSPAPDGLPYWQICAACPETYQQIPDLVRDRHNPNIIAEGMSDDAAVGARYFLISRPRNVIVVQKKLDPKWQRVHNMMERKAQERREMADVF